MTITEARQAIANALQSGRITMDEARYRHQRLSEISTGWHYGSRISWQQKKVTARIIVADLLD